MVSEVCIPIFRRSYCLPKIFYSLIYVVLDLLDQNNFAPVEGEGKNGQAVIISQREMLKMHQQFSINRYNLLASDRIPLNRTLPDVRKKK